MYFKGNGSRQLTDYLAFKVCGHLNKKHDIRNLFLFLRVEGYKIDAIFQNNINDREELVYQLMTEWRKRMKSPEEAYTTLWKALTDQEVNLASIAYEVLKEPPTAEPSEKGKCHCWVSFAGKRPVVSMKKKVEIRTLFLQAQFPSCNAVSQINCIFLYQIYIINAITELYSRKQFLF